MEVLAMRLRARERRKLRQIEEDLRKDDPALGTQLLITRRPIRRHLIHGDPGHRPKP